MGIGFWTPQPKPAPPAPYYPPEKEYAPPVTDPSPWINPVIPPEDEKRPPPASPPDVVIQPIEVPPVILPPPPDMTPPTIVPPEVETPIPVVLPDPDVGSIIPPRPPPTIVSVGALAPVGTFMVFVGKRLVLSMAAAIGQQFGASVGAMLIGPLGKMMARGVHLRYHTGKSPGAMGQVDPTMGRSTRGAALGYEDAWRAVPQEFSYWEK